MAHVCTQYTNPKVQMGAGGKKDHMPKEKVRAFNMTTNEPRCNDGFISETFLINFVHVMSYLMRVPVDSLCYFLYGST